MFLVLRIVDLKSLLSLKVFVNCVKVASEVASVCAV